MPVFAAQMHPMVDQQGIEVAIAVRTRAQASPSRPIAQIRSGIVRGSLRLPTQIVEEPQNSAAPGFAHRHTSATVPPHDCFRRSGTAQRATPLATLRSSVRARSRLRRTIGFAQQQSSDAPWRDDCYATEGGAAPRKPARSSSSHGESELPLWLAATGSVRYPERRDALLLDQIRTNLRCLYARTAS